MARFPKKEAEIVALAERLWRGLLDNASIYPQPPVSPWLIRIKNIIYSSRRDNFIAKQAAAEQATTAKDEVLEELVEAMKADIRYAENTVNYDDDKLIVDIYLLNQKKDKGLILVVSGYALIDDSNNMMKSLFIQ